MAEKCTECGMLIERKLERTEIVKMLKRRVSVYENLLENQPLNEVHGHDADMACWILYDIIREIEEKNNAHSQTNPASGKTTP